MHKALELVPRWTVILRRLSIVNERAGRIEDAVDAARRATRAEPRVSQNHGVLADLLWRNKRHSEALDALRTAVLVQPGYLWGWETLGEWGAAQGRKDLALTEARALASRRPRQALPWIILSELHQQRGETKEALNAVDKGLEINPRDIRLHDKRVQLLLDSEGFEASAKACEPDVFGNLVPRELIGRKAWLLARKGNIPDAIHAMEALLEKEPDYLWGWQMMANWCEETRREGKALVAARRLVRLDPRNPLAHGHLAHSLQKPEDEAESLRALERAFELNPAYDYAAEHLVLFHIRKNNHAAANRVAQRYRRYNPGPDSLSLAAIVAIATGDEDEFNTTAGMLLLGGSDHAPATNQLAEQIKAGTRWEVLWRKHLAEAVCTGHTANPAAAGQWIRRGGTDRWWIWFPAWHIIRLRLPAECEEEALRALVWHRHEHKGFRSLQNLILTQRKQLRRHDSPWAAIGHILHHAKRLDDCLKWMKDWQERPKAEGWMLVPLAHSIDARRGQKAAIAVRKHMLTSAPFRDRYLHEVGLAFTLMTVNSGNAAESISLLSPHRAEELPAYYKILHHLCSVLLEGTRTEPDLRKCVKLMGQAAAVHPSWKRTDPAVNNAFKSTYAAIRKSPALRKSRKHLRKEVDRVSQPLSVKITIGTACILIYLIIKLLLICLRYSK